MALLALGLACSVPAAQIPAPTRSPSGAPEPALPEGYARYDSAKLGFLLGLPPGWSTSSEQPEGVAFRDPSGQGTVLVHVESADTRRLDEAMGLVMYELTGGTAGNLVSRSDTRVAGLPAKQLIASFVAGGVVERIETHVLIDSERIWSLTLATPPDVFDGDRVDYERMVLTFRLKASRLTPAARAAEGRPAPAFDLPAPASKRLTLASLKGPLVLNFFASWCPSCREEMPLLQSRVDRAQGRFQVAGIATHDDPAAADAFARELKMRFPIGFDANGQVADRYQVGGLPVTFFLDSSHVLRRTVVGPLSKDTLEDGLRMIT